MSRTPHSGSSPRVRIGSFTAFTLLLLTAGSLHAQAIKVSAPTLPPPGEAPECPSSYLTVPIQISLETLVARLEMESPREAGTGDAFVPYVNRKNGKEADARYRIWRGPFVLSAENDIIEIRAAIFYWLEARGEPFGTAGCGSETDPINGEIGFRCDFAWGDDWSLDIQLTQIPTVHRGRCKPKDTGINFSRLLVPLVDEEITVPALKLFSEIVRKSEVLPAIVADAWALLQEPVEIGSYDMWLTFRPTGALVSPIVLSGDALATEVAFEVSPRLLIGDRPEHDATDLHDTKVRLYSEELRVAFDCGFSFESIEEAIGELCATGIEGLHVDKARVFGGEDRIAIALTLSGKIRGTVYLAGTMGYDPPSGLLSVRGLRFTEESNEALLAALAPEESEELASSLKSLLTCVASRCSSNIGPAVETYLSQLGRGLNFPISDAFTVSGGVRMRETAGVYLTDRMIGVRQLAIGHATFEPTE